VREDIQFWATLHGAHFSIEDVLRGVGLETKEALRTGKLSAGQKKRLALAKLIISHKPIWLLDEPSAAARSISSSTRLLTLSAGT